MATRSKKRKRVIRHTNVYLPDEILQNIFSFLPFKPLARTTILSKHWNNVSLWRTNAHLDFSVLSRSSPKSMDFVPTVLSRRQPGSKVTTFRLSGHVSAPCLQDWINHVVNHGIKQLELDLHIDRSFINIPMCLFGCRTLKVLTLKHKSNKRYKICFPSADWFFNYLTSTGFPSVHTLSLTNVCLSHGWDWFFGKDLPLLRKLCLKSCRGLSDLIIHCPGLEILQLEGLWLQGLDISGIGLLELRISMCFQYVHRRAKILAPCLKILCWEGVSAQFSVQSTPFFNYNALDRATLQSPSTLLSAIGFATSMFVGSGSGVLEVSFSFDL